MKKLMPMTDYVLEQRNNKDTDNIRRFWACERYANFLKQPLTLGMFIPTDENGNVLEEPNKYVNWTNYDYSGTDIGFEDERLCRQFQQAKERVIFEGFELINDELINNGILFWVGKFNGNETIENCIPSNLTITENALKKYGL